MISNELLIELIKEVQEQLILNEVSSAMNLLNGAVLALGGKLKEVE